MLIRILISLVVGLAATVLMPMLSDQEPYVPDTDIWNALPLVMSPGPEAVGDRLSPKDTLVAYGFTLPERGYSIGWPARL
jgi:hypothetical protein